MAAVSSPTHCLFFDISPILKTLLHCPLLDSSFQDISPSFEVYGASLKDLIAWLNPQNPIHGNKRNRGVAARMVVISYVSKCQITSLKESNPSWKVKAQTMEQFYLPTKKNSTRWIHLLHNQYRVDIHQKDLEQPYKILTFPTPINCYTIFRIIKKRLPSRGWIHNSQTWAFQPRRSPSQRPIIGYLPLPIVSIATCKEFLFLTQIKCHFNVLNLDQKFHGIYNQGTNCNDDLQLFSHSKELTQTTVGALLFQTC
ncbi:hypothetical protein IE077_003417 [Cardiosporidium cionae]|uniref:Uncharacterized protein n=1 Tax=Cardiosporidium cionae TaxID=476202 RepID=A0ABQ7J8A2_9APIC|nr:hypothetical protein IE077_003417 [Cardiosporidium cionae]|eukprot:KAF8820222.1 hypothetical protein IE077_003417 [Cardiosporidium cionae]